MTAPDRWHLRCHYDGDPAFAEEAAYFVAGMVAATYGVVIDCETSPDDGDFVIEALGDVAPTPDAISKWLAITDLILPKLLDGGRVAIAPGARRGGRCG